MGHFNDTVQLHRTFPWIWIYITMSAPQNSFVKEKNDYNDYNSALEFQVMKLTQGYTSTAVEIRNFNVYFRFIYVAMCWTLNSSIFRKPATTFKNLINLTE